MAETHPVDKSWWDERRNEFGYYSLTTDDRVLIDAALSAASSVAPPAGTHVCICGKYPHTNECAGISLPSDAVATPCPSCAGLRAERDDYREVYEDAKRLAREIDVAMHGVDGAAKTPSLLDLVGPAQKLRAERDLLRAALVLAQRWLSNCVPVVELDGPKPLPVIAAALAASPTAPEGTKE